MAAKSKDPPDLRERAVRLYRESTPKPVIAQLARQLNVHPEALRNWIRQDEADRGARHDRPTTEMLEENRRLRAEVKQLRAVNEVLKAASAYFASEIDPTRRRSRTSLMRMTSRSVSYYGSWVSQPRPTRWRARRQPSRRTREDAGLLT